MDKLLSLIKKKNPSANFQLIEKAYSVAQKAHAGIVRKTGEAYITHPVGVAQLLAQYSFVETEIICAALLHDVLEDSTYKQSQMISDFGEEITSIVDGLTKLTEKETGYENYKAENLRKIILATAKDTRVMIIKLVDRIHNLQSLDIFRSEKKKRIAEETMKIYAPIAEKIGLYSIKAELEDLCLKYLNPTIYDFIQRKIDVTSEQRHENTEQIISDFQQTLEKQGLHPRITGRAKHLYSIFKKMTEENKTIAQIYDLYGIRIILPHIDDCYKAHELFTTNFTCIPERFKDYIKNPKPNGYKSIHENILYKGRIIEIQIRTEAMDYQAESGIATHWKYKGTERDKKFDKKIAWLKQLLRWKKSASKEYDTVHDVDIDIFKNEIVAVTPKGDPLILSDPATPLDFAFAIHSDVGIKTKFAKVNNKMVPLDYIIQSGDIVSIETAKQSTVNPGWLKIAKHTSAINRIKRELGIDIEHAPKKDRDKIQKQKDLSNHYHTLRQFTDLTKKKNVKISQCCSPKTTDPIVAYYTKDRRSITVHRFDCPNQFMLEERNKVIIQTTPIQITSNRIIDIMIDDKKGVLVSVLNTVLESNREIHSITTKDAKNSLLLSITFERKGKNIVDELVSKIKDIPGVLGAKLVE